MFFLFTYENCIDPGRVCRPLFIVNPDQKLAIKKHHINSLNDDAQLSGEQIDCKTFTALMQKGLVEYIDCEEEETCMIAMKPEVTRNCYPKKKI
jgi:DNA-directed RNA polymerase II subunit RPB2